MDGSADPTQATCWTMIEAAAGGSSASGRRFAAKYAPIVRAYVTARWKGSPCLAEVGDAVQDVFVECFKQGGILEKADPERSGGFRAFLYGVVRNVARRVESRVAANRVGGFPSDFDPGQVPGRGEALSLVFDRAWARAITREAAHHLVDRAASRTSAGARKRAELLRLRYQEGLSVGEIARLWGVEPDSLHPEFTRARREFKDALLEVLRCHHPESPAAAQGDYTRLMELL